LHFGIEFVLAKAPSKTLMNFTPGSNFTNILRADFLTIALRNKVQAQIASAIKQCKTFSYKKLLSVKFYNIL